MKAKRQIEIAKILGDFNLNFSPITKRWEMFT